MSFTKVAALTCLAMLAFAANSLLCRVALRPTALRITAIDAATFTTVRLLAGALTLYLVTHFRHRPSPTAGNWLSGLALFIYAAAFSFAYISLPASTGALLLFGAVQATMILYGLWIGERFRPIQLVGLALALTGLVILFLPKLTAPPLGGAGLMLSAGAAWGVYSLRGRGAGDPTQTTAGNFLRAAPMAIVLSAVLFFRAQASWDATGLVCALCSGALTSGIGYLIWYTALPALKPMIAATVQLSVPVLTAIGGILFLGESFTMTLASASIAILGGIALVIFGKRSTAMPPLVARNSEGRS
jgi:drug/metabolite transporter (DMT)-like permease